MDFYKTADSKVSKYNPYATAFHRHHVNSAGGIDTVKQILNCSVSIYGARFFDTARKCFINYIGEIEEDGRAVVKYITQYGVHTERTYTSAIISLHVLSKAYASLTRLNFERNHG